MAPRRGVSRLVRSPDLIAESLFRTQFHARPGLYHDWTPSAASHAAALRLAVRLRHGLDHSWTVAQVRECFAAVDPSLCERIRICFRRQPDRSARFSHTLRAFISYANILCSSILEIREGRYGLGCFALRPFDGLSPLPLLVGVHIHASAADFAWLCREDVTREGVTCRRGISIIAMHHSEPRFRTLTRHAAVVVEEARAARESRHRPRLQGRTSRRSRYWQAMHRYDVVFAGPLSFLNHSSSRKTQNVYPYVRGSNVADGYEVAWWRSAHVIGGNPLKIGDELLLDYGSEYGKLLRLLSTKRKRDAEVDREEIERAKCSKMVDGTRRVLRRDSVAITINGQYCSEVQTPVVPVAIVITRDPNRPLSRWRHVPELQISLRNRSAH